MKIVLHLEVDEEELSIDKDAWNAMTKDEKERELSLALNEWINEKIDWSQVYTIEESD